MTPELESLLLRYSNYPRQRVSAYGPGLAELLGKQVKHINRDSYNLNIASVKSLQPIEIILDYGDVGSQKRPQGGGNLIIFMI